MHEAEAPPIPNAGADRKDSLANIRAAIHRKAARRRENSDVNTLVSDFGFLWVQQPNKRRAQYSEANLLAVPSTLQLGILSPP